MIHTRVTRGGAKFVEIKMKRLACIFYFAKERKPYASHFDALKCTLIVALPETFVIPIYRLGGIYHRLRPIPDPFIPNSLLPQQSGPTMKAWLRHRFSTGSTIPSKQQSKHE